MTINQLIENELAILNTEEKRHLSRGNWQKAADTVTKRDYLLRFKKRVQDSIIITTMLNNPPS